jgi:hypothetical protein
MLWKLSCTRNETRMTPFRRYMSFIDELNRFRETREERGGRQEKREYRGTLGKVEREREGEGGGA